MAEKRMTFSSKVYQRYQGLRDEGWEHTAAVERITGLMSVTKESVEGIVRRTLARQLGIRLTDLVPGGPESKNQKLVRIYEAVRRQNPTVEADRIVEATARIAGTTEEEVHAALDTRPENEPQDDSDVAEGPIQTTEGQIIRDVLLHDWVAEMIRDITGLSKIDIRRELRQLLRTEGQ